MIKHYGHDVKADTYVLWYTKDKDVVGLYLNAEGKKIATSKLNGFEYVEKNNLSQYLNGEMQYIKES